MCGKYAQVAHLKSHPIKVDRPQMAPAVHRDHLPKCAAGPARSAQGRRRAHQVERLDELALGCCGADDDVRPVEVEPAPHSVDDDQERASASAIDDCNSEVCRALVLLVRFERAARRAAAAYGVDYLAAISPSCML